MNRIELAIERAVKLRPSNVLITETFDLARTQAKTALEAGLVPFPLVVKDCYSTRNYATTCGSLMLDKYSPSFDATVVRRLVQKGACIIGKSNLDEFCMGTSSVLGHYGPVKSNIVPPSEEDWLVPGGSSGGSAVAVQAGISDVALGSDTGGSTRNPAAFNGIFGFKPTYGVLSRHGLVPLVNSMDSPAIFARNSRDCWKYLDFMKGVDENDSTSIDLVENTVPIDQLTVGVPMEYHNETLTEEAWRWWNRAANILEKKGAKIVKVSLPHTKYSLACYHVLSTADVASNMARYDSVGYGYREPADSTNELYSKSRSASLNETVRKRIFAGNYFLMKRIRDKYYNRALKVRRKISDELLQVLREVDVILTPSAAGPAPMYSELRDGLFSREDQDDFFTQAANLAGIPAISVPIGDTNGLPIGVQLLAGRGKDRLICDVAEALEQK